MIRLENRYSRQTFVQTCWTGGQDKLSSSHVVIIGCGALGSAISETLVRAGVGKLTIADRDYVESTNYKDNSYLSNKMRVMVYRKWWQLKDG